MDVEEEKRIMGLKRKKCKLMADSDDDEPIGALLKLKGKRNSKQTKKKSEVEKMDDELGDTLANFRKKLKKGSAAIGSNLVSEGSEVKSKRRRKSAAGNGENEGAEDSLSAFFHKVNCSKSRPSSRMKRGTGTQVLDDGPSPVADEIPGDSSVKAFSDDEDSAFTALVHRNSTTPSLRVRATGMGDGEINVEGVEERPGSSNELRNSNDILDGNDGVLRCVEGETRDDEVKVGSGMDTDLALDCSGQMPIHSSPSAFREEQQSGEHDGPVTVLGKCLEESNHVAPFPSGEADDDDVSSSSPSENLKYEVVFRKHKEDETERAGIESDPVLEPFCRELPEGACPSNSDCPSEDEQVNGTSCSYQQGSSAEDRESIGDRQNKENGLPVGQRAARKKTKKQRHGDMAYEGDVDWEVLMQSQEFFSSHQIAGKTKGRLNSPSAAVDAETGKAAAVAAGLKARAAGPLEKIKFKEVFKRKGGLQEYLECRNHILSVWNKDVSRILPLADFGVSDVPLVGESPRASLIRDIFTFLDQCGYINFGVPSAKDKVENSVQHNTKFLTDEKFEELSGLAVAESDDGVSLILDKEKISESCVMEKNSAAFSDGSMAGKAISQQGPVNLQTFECIADGCPPDESHGINSFNCIPSTEASDAEYLGSVPSCGDENGESIPAEESELLPRGEAISSLTAEIPRSGSAILPETAFDFGQKRNVIIVGAGPAGLTAARHLQRQGFGVTVLEARNRIGGRVFTDRSSLSVPVDLGASIITGVEADVASQRRPDPSSLICAQLGLEMTVLNSDCPLYDTVTGQRVPADLDDALESEYNCLLDDMVLLADEKGDSAMKMSLEEGLEFGLKRRRVVHSRPDATSIGSQDASVAAEMSVVRDEVSNAQGSKTEGLSPLERRVMDWHFAHLEYGCAALLKEVSLPHWNQDDVYGGFGGAHCMIKGGYSAVVESLAEGTPIHLDHVVTDISYHPKDCEATNEIHRKVKVSTLNGKEFSGDAVLVTVPLGCLKAETIKFSPPLPQWKYLSIKRLGYGVLNKVVLEFPEVFWDDTIDYFGATAEDTDQRGRCFMFWNVKKTVGAPVLIALLVGKAAVDGQNVSSSNHVSHALLVLRKLFGEDKVSDPVASVVTDWGRDPYSYGAYSYVAVGSSGEDYDILGRPVGSCLFFAGEATCKEHPDTVGGAMMSGLREAVRIIDILNTGTDYTAEVEAMEAARRHLDIERSEVKDIIRRLDALEFSSVTYRKSSEGFQISSWGSTLKDLFFTAKTTAGRLHLAKELLNLPVGFLKSFASTKEGLSTLNSWILDSMGKDGTQLLRHCVRLLVLVSNDLLAVRLSGVGRTIKEKVCVHTSRDIRAIGSQLVRVWVEIFRKNKASKGKLKSLKQPTTLDSKSKAPHVFGKPPLRTSGGQQVPSTRNAVEESDKSETRFQPKPDQLADPHGSGKCKNGMEEDSEEIPMSEEEKAAIAAAEAARAAAIAAAKAYASIGTRYNASLQPPKILSFHKFATRGQLPHIDASDSRKNWSGAAIGRQDCLSEIDSRNCRVRDWSVDFSATGVNPESSKMLIDNPSQRSQSNEFASQMNVREHSGESAAVNGSLLTKAWVDSAGSMGIKDYSAIERWQCQAAAASSSFSHGSMHIMDEEDSNMSSKLHKQKHDTLQSSASQVTINKESKGNQPRGAERIKQSVVDYVASLLMPLYKARKIDRDGYKSIMKKTATKVMEQTTDVEKSMAVFEFLDFKRKNKIRAFVDMLIERHMAHKSDPKSGASGKD